jgi:hypothetical protein
MKDDDKFEEVVSRALEKGTTFGLPQDFADRVVRKIQQESLQKETQRDRWWLIAGIISMIGAVVFAFTNVDFKPSVGVFTFFKGYSGLVIFGVVFIIILQVIDKRIISHRSHRSNR